MRSTSGFALKVQPIFYADLSIVVSDIGIFNNRGQTTVYKQKAAHPIIQAGRAKSGVPLASRYHHKLSE